MTHVANYFLWYKLESFLNFSNNMKMTIRGQLGKIGNLLFRNGSAY